MNTTTTVWGHVDTDDIITARERLLAFCMRHGIALDDVYDNGRWSKDPGGDVNLILDDLYSQCGSYEPNPYGKRVYRNALRIFRRAVGSTRATFLHHDSAGYVQFAR